jgi:thiol:disulfide interchange protein DsbD
MKHLNSILLILAITTGLLQSQSSSPFGQDSMTKAEIISEVSQTAPGESFTIAIQLEHADGWHAYYQNPGGPGLPLEFDWQLPDGFKLDQLHWPTPKLYSSDDTQFYIYEKQYTLLADISVAGTATSGADIVVTPTWQLCDDQGCAPPESEVKESNLVLHISTTDGSVAIIKSLHYVDNAGLTDASKKQTLNDLGDAYVLKAPLKASAKPGESISGILLFGDQTALSFTTPLANTPAEQTTSVSAAQVSSSHGPSNRAPTEEEIAAAAELYDAERKIDFVLLDGSQEKAHSLLTALGFIFIGGLLLNLMPCVFPVLGLKVMGFAQQAGSEPQKIKIHGLVFMTGVLVSMWILAGIIYVLIFTFGRDVNWGEQLTSPIFLAAIIMLLYLFGLNMAGVFEIGTSLTGAGGELQAKKGYSGSFFSGVLTTLIATPCSGPFLGSVMGYTLKQPPLQGMLIFSVFALGISSPYVVLAFFPKLINKLPKPGAWMVTFKQLMAFALFATAAYFFRSFAKITGTGGASWLLMAAVVIGLAVWAYGRFGTPYTPKVKKYVWGISFPILVATGAFFMTKSATEERAPATPLTGSSWYPGVVELNRSKGRIVWVDYTADW